MWKSAAKKMGRLPGCATTCSPASAVGNAIPTLTGLMLSGCYKIPAIQMNVTATFTNKMSTDAYRGAGRPEATYVVERAADLVAAELGMDPVEVRRKNFPQPNEFPFKTAT